MDSYKAEFVELPAEDAPLIVAGELTAIHIKRSLMESYEGRLGK